MVLDDTGSLVASPSISTRGVIHVDESVDFIETCELEVTKRLEAMSNADEFEHEAAIRRTLRRLFKAQYNRRPLIVPAVVVSQK